MSVCLPTYIAQSAGAVEYTKCFSAEGSNSLIERPQYNTKQSDGEFPISQELWGMRITSSLLLLQGPLWPKMVAHEQVLSLGQIELNYVPIMNWIAWNRTVCV